jgi:hypothetical protein
VEERETTTPDAKRGERGKWLPGRSPNPGGRSKKIVAIEAMLDAEHRTVENMRETYGVLRDCAQGKHQGETVTKDGEVVTYTLPPDKGMMELYLNRVQGPIEKLKVDLKDAPDEVVSWVAENVQ